MRIRTKNSAARRPLWRAAVAQTMALVIFICLLIPAQAIAEGASVSAWSPKASIERSADPTASLLMKHIVHAHCFYDGVVSRPFLNDSAIRLYGLHAEYPPLDDDVLLPSEGSLPFKPPRS